MKTVLLYTDTPQVGGAELQMFLLAKFLDKGKFRPLLVCSNYKSLDKLCENFEKEGIQVYRIQVRSKHDPKHLKYLKQIIREEKVDLLHAHVWNPASCRYAFVAANSMNIPVVTTEHDPFKLSFLKNLFKKHTLKSISKIITVSNENKRVISTLYPKFKDKIAVIHNGIDTTWWQSQLLRFTEEDLLKIKKEVFACAPDALIITAVAELHERKGLKYLIEATAKLATKYPNIKTIIVGEGPHHEQLENLITELKIENNVLLVGKRNNIPEILKSSNIFVLPSVREAFGLVNLEAMLTPLPIVASKVGGIPEIVINKETGILVESENSQALKEALEKLIKSPELRENYATAGKNRAKENFSADKMAIQYEKIYSESI